MHVCSGLYSHHEGEVVQSGGSVVRGQVGVQVPRRSIRRHGLEAQLPVDQHSTRIQSSAYDSAAVLRPVPTTLFFARADEGGKTSFGARGCGARGRSWGAFCAGAAVDARVLVCGRRKRQI